MNLPERARLAYNDWKAREESNLILAADQALAWILQCNPEDLEDATERVDVHSSPPGVVYVVDGWQFKVTVDRKQNMRTEKQSNEGLLLDDETTIEVRVERNGTWSPVNSLADVGRVFCRDPLPEVADEPEEAAA